MNKKLLVLLLAVIALVAVGGILYNRDAMQADGGDTPVAGQDQNFGGGINEPERHPLGIGIGNVSWLLNRTNYVGGEFYPTQNDVQDAWYNNTGRDVFADLGVIQTPATASSSLRFSMFATTSSAMASTHDYINLVATSTGLIDNLIVTTSTPATTTNSLQGTSNRVIRIPDGWYLQVYMQTWCDAESDNNCENATSTTIFRGSQNPVRWFARLFY